MSVELEGDNGRSATLKTFSLAQLEALPSAGFRTSTIWTQGPQTFEGVWFATMLRELGVSEGTVVLSAFNDYSITAQAADFTEGGALLAFRRNGRPMTSRNNGPLWLVWNYDADPDFRTESIYALSIWQLDQITISR